MTGRVVDGTAYVPTITLDGETAAPSTYLLPFLDVDDADIAPYWKGSTDAD